LLAHPTRFLSTIQLGITLVGVLAGAFGAVTIAARLALRFESVPWLGQAAQPVAFAIVVVGVTYLSLVFGELIPKRIALSRPEHFAMRLAPGVRRLATIARPLVTLLAGSTEMVARLLRIRAAPTHAVTEDEIRAMIDRGTLTGAVEPAERDVLDRVFRLGNRTVAAVMTPHPDLVWLDRNDSASVIRDQICGSPGSHYPVIRGGRDNVLGQVLRLRDVDLDAALRPAVFVPAVMPALAVLDRLKESPTGAALVIDEYGSVQGLVTADDLLEEIVGELPEAVAASEPEVVRRPDGSWLLDGAIAADELKGILELEQLPGEPDRSYGTLGGLVMAELGRVPSAGDSITCGRWRLEVVDMDGRRVDKVLASVTSSPPQVP
jgi:putative hemolysin